MAPFYHTDIRKHKHVCAFGDTVADYTTKITKGAYSNSLTDVQMVPAGSVADTKFHFAEFTSSNINCPFHKVYAYDESSPVTSSTTAPFVAIPSDINLS